MWWCRFTGPSENNNYSNTPSPPSEIEFDFHTDIDNTQHKSLSRKEKAKSLPSFHPLNSHTNDQPDTQHLLSHSPNRLSPSSFRTLSPNSSRTLRPANPNSQSPNTSPKNSPINAAKNFFRLSGSHLKHTLSPHSSPRGSPRNSPLLGRRKLFGNHSTDEDRDSEFVHWWMEDVAPGEVNHWSQVLKKEGEWIYFWHSIRYMLKSASSWDVCFECEHCVVTSSSLC